MQYASSATRSFPAAHRLIGHPRCARNHGHLWTVTAHAQHEELDETGYARGAISLPVVLDMLVREVADRDLAEMIDGHKTPIGVAAWFFERMAGSVKTLVRVDVNHEHEAGSVQKT